MNYIQITALATVVVWTIAVALASGWPDSIDETFLSPTFPQHSRGQNYPLIGLANARSNAKEAKLQQVSIIQEG
jgi:hypothetical protein